jgi:uncharacterized protein (DUF983 family)
MAEPIPSLRTVLARGMRRRCPQCGRGNVFKSWLKLHDHCEVCGLQFLNNQGDLWAYLVAVDRALFIFPLIVMIYFRIYNPHSPWYYVFSIALLAGFLYTLPHRNGMSLGVDYLIRRKHGDLSGKESPPKPDAPPQP